MRRSNVDSSRGAADAGSLPPDASRQRVLHASAVGTARAWTLDWFRTLVADGRRIEGGWPGTLPEARARASADAARALAGSSPTELTREELFELTRTVYEEARRLWRTNATSTG